MLLCFRVAEEDKPTFSGDIHNEKLASPVDTPGTAHHAEGADYSQGNFR